RIVALNCHDGGRRAVGRTFLSIGTDKNVRATVPRTALLQQFLRVLAVEIGEALDALQRRDIRLVANRAIQILDGHASQHGIIADACLVQTEVAPATAFERRQVADGGFRKLKGRSWRYLGLNKT